MSLFHLTQAIELGDWAAVEAAAVYISRSETKLLETNKCQRERDRECGREGTPRLGILTLDHERLHSRVPGNTSDTH